MTLAREILIRVAVGVALLPVVGALLWLGGPWSAGLFALAAAIAAYEYYRMTELRGARVRWIGVAAAAVLAALPWAAAADWAAVAAGVVAAASIASWTSLLLWGPRSDAPRRAGALAGGLAFVGVGLVALAALRARGDGLAWSAGVLIAAWANDTGAFFGGKLVGRHRLIPSVSPGKTWEGLAIGGAAGLAAMLAARPWLAGIALGDAIAIGAVAAVLGPIGDLCKSMVKRAAGVKDAGRLLLAHGGMLDRIDAILFDAPGVLAYLAVRAALHG